MEGEEVAVEHGWLADFGVGVEFGGEEGNGHVVAGAVDDGVDVLEGGAVG